MKKIYAVCIFGLCILSGSRLFAAPPASSAGRINVDGISGNTRVVITGRNPVFSWDFTYTSGRSQDTVLIEIGTSVGSANLWSSSGVLLVPYKVYAGSALSPNTTYYWQITITDDGSETSAPVQSSFHTIVSAVSLSASKADLKIAWNNPFNPYTGQKTTIRYQLTDGNEDVIIRIYTITGELVRTLANHLAQQSALYSVDWDGTNSKGEIVASGIYLVNLKAGTSIRKTRRVAVIK